MVDVIKNKKNTMYRKREASVESVIGGAPKKTRRQTYHTTRDHLESTALRVEKMKTVRLERPKSAPGKHEPGTLDGGITLE